MHTVSLPLPLCSRKYGQRYIVSRYPREHACVWSFAGPLERTLARLRVREPGLLPALRPSSIDRHIFPIHFCRASRIYKMQRKRRINTRRSPTAYIRAGAACPRFGARLAVDLANNRTDAFPPAAFRMLCFLGRSIRPRICSALGIIGHTCARENVNYQFTVGSRHLFGSFVRTDDEFYARPSIVFRGYFREMFRDLSDARELEARKLAFHRIKQKCITFFSSLLK